MINKYPLWKNLLIVAVIVLAAIYAAPNLYAPDPAIQISHESGEVDQSALDNALVTLDIEGISYFDAQIENGVGLIRLNDESEQSRAQVLINIALPDDYIVALNMAPTTPSWLRSFGAGPMTLGLDLSGGVHFLMEVDMDAALSKRLNDSLATIRGLLREERLRYRSPIEVDDQNRLVVRFANEEVRSQANSLIRDEFPEFNFRTSEVGGDAIVYYTYNEAAALELQEYALQQNLTTLRSRVSELGVKEPKIQRMGSNRIVIELPGIQDTSRAKELISAVATLELHLGANNNSPSGATEEFEYEGTFIEIDSDTFVSGESVTNAQSSFDENGFPQVSITLDAVGARDMNEGTRYNVGNMMGILLVETKITTETEIGADGEVISTSIPVEERTMISWARINDALGRQFRITGLEPKEANDLALLIRSGALAAPMYFLEESTIGPSLGQENIDKGLMSVQIGLAAVVLFMLVYYRVFGLIANIALAINLVLLVALMSIFGGTLTLPGIAGIVLTVGMAVDANVLIFARIREELKNGLSVQKAIDSGFGRALVTIMDANITTLLVAIILYSIGSGPVQGFAVTLWIGIVTSVFTAVIVTRAMVNVIYGGRNVKKLSIGIKMPAPSTEATS